MATTTVNTSIRLPKVSASASASSGFAPWRTSITYGLVFLTFVYSIVYYIVENSSSSSTELFRPAPQYCGGGASSSEGCSRPDLFAFQVSSAVMQCFMGFTGFYAWHVKKIRPTTREGRLFDYIPDADRLNAGIFVFQTWDFLASLAIPEHATPVFLTHHVLAALTAYFSLEYRYVHYYAIFFGGCSEISSIFLVVCDFNEYFPASHGSVWGAIVLFCQAMFVLMFFYYRVIGWWQVSYSLWSDGLHVLTREDPEEKYHGRGQTTFLYFFLGIDVCLGLLQLYWFGFGILPKILEIANA